MRKLENGENCNKIIYLMPNPSPEGGMTAISKMFYEIKIFENSSTLHFDTNFNWGSSSIFKIVEFFFKKIQFIILLIKERPDSIIVMTSSFFGFYDKSIYCLIARLFRVKSFLNPVGGGFQDFHEGSFLNKIIVPICLKFPSAIFIGSTYWIDYFKSNFSNLKLYDIPNPIIVPNEKKNWNLTNENILKVVSISNIIAPKGIIELIDVIKLVCKKTDRITFTICGGGNLIDLIKMELKSLIDDKKVEILGYISDEKKKAELLKADLFIMLSHFEVIPISILEAMSIGLPIISTNVGGIPDLVSDGDNGFLFNVGDIEQTANQLIELSKSDNSYLKQLGTNSANLIKNKYDINKVIKAQRSAISNFDLSTKGINSV